MGMNLILLTAALAMTGPVSGGKAAVPPPVGDPVIEHCLVSLIEEAQIPGREPGVVAALEAKEGMQVKAGTIIGRIDDSEPTALKRVKMKEHDTEKEKATNDVNVRYAIAATEVAKLAYEKSLEADSRVKGSVTKIDLNKLKLEWRKAELQIEQAQLEKKVAGLTSDVKGAEVDSADLSIRRREICLADRRHRRQGLSASGRMGGPGRSRRADRSRRLPPPRSLPQFPRFRSGRD